MATSSSSTTRQQQHEMVNAFEEIASPSCRGYPSSSSMPSKVPWDVFINHRGIDVKHTLAKAVYDTLHHMQVQVFLDMEGIEPGDLIPMEIQEAMNSALLHIAIFSKNYAQSPWCLSELSFILNTGTKIIPIFYHTEPSDLRYAVKGKGIYADSFDEHVRKGRYSSDKIQEWKMALNTASFFSGYQLHDDNWGWVLESLEISVAKMMRKKPLELSTVPVGLDQIVEDFKKHTNDDSGEIVGIVGLGGCGKTTLAKEVYNRKLASYHRSSFLYDVREQAHQGKLPRLQKKLLEDLRLQGSSFKNVNAGIDILADRLRSQRMLIVLDDLDDMDQMDALLPAKDKLGSGSLIIVTTRKLDLLTSLGITSIYRMKELNPFHAKQLFCCYAFSHSDPLHGFEDLVEKFVNACCRLPLSLKVIGRQLCRKPKEYWESQLHKLSRKLPDRITDTLKISYEALDEEEQDVFLDVACFFIGEQKSLAIAVWDGSGWSGVHSWETLMNRCLVELDDQNRIRMHDHLRDLGRKIAEQKSPYRIWFPEQIDNIQEQTKIRGIMAATIDSSRDYSKTCLSAYSPPSEKWLELTKCFSRIKLLVFKEDYFVESFWLQCCRGLLWIRIFGFNHTNLVFFFNSFENLRVLELYEVERLESLWGEYDKPPLQLRELIVDFRNSTSFLQMSPTNYFQGFPRSIGLLQHLEKIVFSGEGFCITDLPQEFCHLRSLKHLELTRFKILLSLPSRFGNLTNLRHLVLSNCWELSTLPVSFKQLARLRYLDFSGCRKLRFPSDILVNMTKLEYMNFDGVWELQELPHHFTQQVSLTELNLDKTSLRNVAAKIISQLKKLEVLTIGSDFLTRFPASIGDLSCLTSLSIHLCKKLESLPDSVGRLNQLQSLSIVSSGLKSLPETLKQMSNLQYLGIFGCPLAALPFGSSFTSSSLHKLKEIRLHDTRLSTISISEDCCPSLEIVELLNPAGFKGD